MELRQLRYFLSVADARSFVSAANSLYISRQAISKAISQLEGELGVELFMRNSSGAFLTPAGIMFYDRVRVLVMELDNVRSQMQAYGTRYHQRIRLACAIGTMPLLEDALLEYMDIQQNAEIVYHEWPERECLRLLMEHEADVAISTEKLSDPLFITEELFRSRFGILLQKQKALQELEEISVHDLTWIPLAGQSDSQIQELCSKYGLHLQYNGFDYFRLFELTAAGKCGLLLPQCLVPENLPNTQWIPIQQEEYWVLYKTVPKSAEKNQLYGTALEDLHTNVFEQIGSHL